MKRIRPMLVLLASLALACWGGALAYADNASGASSGNAEAVADGNTASTWRDWGLENSTENVGRIWTDKTVQAGDITLTGAGGEKTIAKGDSTFLTALSAISSTSNLKSTATTPLDIVLVLDASGSMDGPMGSTDDTKRIVALQKAANSFIDNVAAQNASISDSAKQHHVSIVKFAGNKTDEVGNQTYYGWRNENRYTFNYSQVMKTMSACTDDSKASFKSTIDSIVPAGATRADYGMELAQGQTSGRDDAKKIVIFFTDGTPTSWDKFDSDVASNAVSAAKSMKDSSASIYTIGIFDGANPSASVDGWGTSTENKFMQAVSSNYPSATYNGARWNFGTRADNADYYKSATNADELKKVFDDISQEIVQGAGYPTDTKEGFEADSGFITFTDQLGDYMKVDGFTSIVFANQVFENPTKATNGLVDTYTFTGEAGNALYPKGNLNAIDITVTRSEDLQTGDKVEVKIPAALIPLRNFTVNADGTGSVDLAFPIRAFYGSSLKDGVAEALANPDSALAAYLANNSADGKVSFLANKWCGGVDGDTIADFTPSKGNSYYYITEDTPIYQDEACTQRAAAPLEKGKTYYYQRTWYDLEGGNAVQKTKTVSFDSGVVENIDGYISSDAGKAYFKAGTPRMTYLNELNTKKGEDKSRVSANNTNTAETFINPKWAGVAVNVHLGNNGKLSVSQPGTLAVSKTLQVPEGYNAGDFADESFEFTIMVPDAKGATLKAQVKNAAGEVVGSAFDIAFDENGTATHSLKSGETLYVYGLAAGTEYTVSESAKAGFTQTAPVDEAGAAAAATGAIKAGEASHADFTNTYDTQTVSWAPMGKKAYSDSTGVNPLKAGMFNFALCAKDGTPMPKGTSAETVECAIDGETWHGVISSAEESGDIAFPQAEYEWLDAYKTFEYKIVEVVKDSTGKWVAVKDALADSSYVRDGMTYDPSVWTAQVTLQKSTDNVLVLDVKYLKDGAEQQGAAFAFANSYSPAPATATINGTKTLTSRDMADGETFGFTLSAADKATQDAVTAGAITIPANTATVSGGKDGKAEGFAFGDMTFAKPGTYTFNVSETHWDGGALPDDGTEGLTFDRAAKTVTVTVTDNGKGQLAAATTVDGVAGNLVSFVNKYRAGDAGFDTANAQLKKVLEGRDWLDSDSFTFTLKALTDGAPLPEGATGGVATTTVTKTNAESFGFGTITFTSSMLDAGSHSKTFEYEVAETKGAIADIDYAANKATIKVTVVDNGEGKLSVSATTENGTFVNRYDASVGYTAHGGLKVAKTLNGRDMTEGQFKIAVTPGNSESAQTLGLSEGANVFAMPAAADGQQVVKQVLEGRDVEFTQKDIGKTYTCTVAEQQDGKAGYTYDQTTYTVAIAVTVSADGKLTVTTNVTGGASAGTHVYTSDSSQTDGVTLAFANAYKATGAVSLSGTKALTGRSLTAGEFSFAVKYAAADGDLLSAKNAADGSIDFGTLSYSTEALAQLVKEGKAVKGQDGTWTVNYVAYEKTSSLPGGVTAQTQPIPFTVTVADNGDGTLTATPNVGNGLKFQNTYGADAVDVQLSGKKELKAAEGLEPGDITGKFTFTVTGEKGAPLPEHATATNDAKGNIDFGAITFTLDDLNKALGTSGAETQSATNEPVTNVPAQGSATAAESGESANAKSPSAENTQATEGAGGGAVVSSQGESMSANDSGAVEREATANIGAAENDGAVAATAQTVKAESSTAAAASVDATSAPAAASATATASVQEGTASSQVGTPTVQAGTPRSHVFTYKITESGSAAGVTNDTATKTVSFKVTDDGNGKLTVTRVEPAGDSKAASTFTNTYSVQPKDSSVTDQIAVTKQLTGRDLKAGEFHFELLDGADVVATGTNDAAGNVALSKITYKAPGTHTYTLREVGGGTQQAGVSYDGATFDVITTVTDAGDGTLSVVHTLSNGEAAAMFDNAYSPAATSVTLGAAKVLKGKSLEAGEFSFLLTGEDGSKATAKNDAAGNVMFGALEFSKEDTYHYTIAEEKGSEAGVTYDETTYPVTVTVKDDGQGNLTAEVSYEQGEVPVFTNSYEEPESPLSFITGGGANGGSHSGTTSGAAGAAVKTGDGTLALAAVIAAVAALAIGIGALSFGRGRKHK